jgi:DNA ligase-associated metallophosphoesterase
VEIEIGVGRKERLVLLPQLAAWLPARRMVLAADLHLGKAEVLRGKGAAVPRRVLMGLMEETLGRLSDAVAVVEGFGGGGGVERIVIVGDLIHAPCGVTEDVKECWEGWIRVQKHAGRRVVCVRGNHDRELERLCGEDVEMVERIEEDGVVLTHDPREVVEGRMVIGGHLHPAFVVGGGRSRMKLPAFVAGRERVVLPAFTRFATGMTIEVREGERVFVVGAGEVIGVELKVESLKGKEIGKSRYQI